jgi:hypothetical protein
VAFGVTPPVEKMNSVARLRVSAEDARLVNCASVQSRSGWVTKNRPVSNMVQPRATNRAIMVRSNSYPELVCDACEKFGLRQNSTVT